MAEFVACPFTPFPVEKFEHIVTKCTAHRPWFHDYLWKDDAMRRQAVIAYLADAFNAGKIWECWRGDALVGILLVNELTPFLSARCHFLFFDSRLADKVALCRNLMGWCFTQLPVETLRVELPTYAHKLEHFVLKLGFRYEAENRAFSWPKQAAPLSRDDARLGSRKHRATLYEGVWHDLLLLSVTVDEFREQERVHGRPVSHSPQ